MPTKRLCKFGFNGLYTPALFSVAVGIEENDSHWVKRVRIISYPGPYFPAFSHNRSEYGKILGISPYSVRTRENAEKMRTMITLNRDTFYALGFYLLFLSHCVCLTDHQKDLTEKSDKFPFCISGTTLNSYMLNLHFV